MFLLRYAAVVVLSTALGGCYAMRPSSGGGQTAFMPPRVVNAADVAVPAGYRIEVVSTGFTFPTSVMFDDQGRPYVVEAGYSYGEVWTQPRLLRVEEQGAPVVVATGSKNGPWTAATYANGVFYIAEGGELEGGRILRVADGKTEAIVEGLPSKGDHHTNGVVLGPDGYLYFGQGTATNSGVVGPDNAKFGWLKRYPQFHDIPCRDIRLSGETFTSPNVLSDEGTATTGAYAAFGTSRDAAGAAQGQLPCNGAIMRISPRGGRLELIAWGFRNPFGLAFSPQGDLYVTENGYDDRGSRPVWGTGDHLWRITPGTWYGWPDYSGDKPLTHEAFRPPGKKPLRFLLAEHPNKPPKPAAVLGVHSSSNGLDFARNPAFGHVGQAFIAQFGDQAPTTGKVMAPVGFKVVRVDPESGIVEDFVVNKGGSNGPASKIGTQGLERPVSARFDPSGTALYIVDFGVLLETPQGTLPQPGTGVLWRVMRTTQ